MFIDYLAMLYQSALKQSFSLKPPLFERKTDFVPEMKNLHVFFQSLSPSEILSLCELVLTYDRQTHIHALRTVSLAGTVAQKMGCDQQTIELSCLAALLHDIGKVAIPSPILFKPGPLNEDEWKIMRLHPEIGRQMLLLLGGIFSSVEHIVVAHHEHWDGGGYPAGLSGEDIPLLARILTVVDSFDAMTTTRVYQQRRSIFDACHELLLGAGHQYDPRIVSIFVSCVISKEIKLYRLT